MTSPLGVVQIGIWWPHQSCRERHQSGISSSEAIANRCCDSGWKRTRRSRSASIAGAAGPLHRAPPLQRDQRLDPRVAPLAGADRVPVVLPLDELAALLDPGDDRRVGLGLRQALEVAGLVVHPAVEADHHRLGKPVVAADLEVQRIVARA